MSPNSYGLARRSASMPVASVARVVAAEAALAERPEQIAQRAVAEEVEALSVTSKRACACVLADLPPCACDCRRPDRVGWSMRDVAFLLHALDDLLDELLELLALGLSHRRSPSSRSSASSDSTPPLEQRVADRVVQRLHRAVVVGSP